MFEAILALIAGLLIGSFLNVCIYRMPRDLSVVRPRSFCPACEHPIAWYDNVPVLSYILLRGRCRHCGQAIPLRYVMVETVTALLFLTIVLALGTTAAAAKLCLLAALLVGLTFSDIEERILPDEFTLGGTLAGLVVSWFVPIGGGVSIAYVLLPAAGIRWSARWMSVAESALGAALPMALLWLAGFAYQKIRHREGLGLGDVKMIAMIGAFLGLYPTLLTLILASVAGSIIGFAYIHAAKKDPRTYELPLGAFLGAAGIFVSLWGEQVIHWYAGFF